jgi:hypothetical protein
MLKDVLEVNVKEKQFVKYSEEPSYTTCRKGCAVLNTVMELWMVVSIRGVAQDNFGPRRPKRVEWRRVFKP